ncbi:hypothetical protein BDU57DRAFT_328608 [Ampelomyces quisqualis]|uniref:Uncharacterized protein n=1 Tax=Ampelomyces quisqualis TaxID=50730 RepID=A0A6A5QGM6_AMPQU|nr:hypothetical protein BDU57DRAFT_328608 [Ampelomyces quisqualis]
MSILLIVSTPTQVSQCDSKRPLSNECRGSALSAKVRHQPWRLQLRVTIPFQVYAAIKYTTCHKKYPRKSHSHVNHASHRIFTGCAHAMPSEKQSSTPAFHILALNANPAPQDWQYPSSRKISPAKQTPFTLVCAAGGPTSCFLGPQVVPRPRP